MKEFSKKPQPPEKTAIDLTEKQRLDLFTGATKILRSRGEVIIPDPNTTYYNEKGKRYTPDPYLEAEIPSDELTPHALPYDRIRLYSKEVDLENIEPTVMHIGTERFVTREIPVDEHTSTLAMGQESQGVIFSREPQLGIVVKEEYGDVDLYPGTPDDEETTYNADGDPITLKGCSLIVDQAPLLSYNELINLTTVFKKIE